MKANAGDGTAALDKAMDVLDAIGAAPHGLTQAELTGRLGVPRTTLYRLLGTLVARGLVRRDPLRHVYCLGLHCFEMARQAYAMPDLVAAAATELRALRDWTGETAYLAALDGLEVVSLERIDGAHSQRSASARGQRKPVHCTSQGKAILSALDDAARDAIVKELPLKALTPLTITDRRRLHAELRITAARGYAIDDEEIMVGVRCVGAPVIDADGAVRGAISVAGPAYRLTRERLELLGPEVAEAARRIGAQLAVQRATPRPDAVSAVEGPWAFLGRFPNWCAQSQRLFWADALAPCVRVWDGQTDHLLAALDAPVLGLAPHRGEVLVAQASGWSVIDAAGALRPFAGCRAAPVRALCTGAGDDLWLAADEAGGGCRVGVLRGTAPFEPAWQINEPVNSLCWSTAGGVLYATAPQTGAVLVLTPGSTVVRRLASMPRGSGEVSGLALDSGGGVWTALKDGWSVVRFAPDGSLDRVLGLPVPCPTDLAFGGASGNTLYITSARHMVPMDTLASAPLSGRLLQVAV